MSPRSKSPDELARKEDKILAYLSHNRLHHRLTLPATEHHEQLIVSYAVVGAGADELCDPSISKEERAKRTRDVPTIIWCGAMQATRWQGAYTQHLGEEMGVRVVYIDRPGIGGSSPVALNQRISVWMETVEHLVRILQLRHIVIASHSAGTIYLMNTLYHHRDLLSPKRPYVAFFGPWVHPQDSGVALLTVAKLLPSTLISQFTNMTQFVAQKIAPSFNFSAGALSASSSLITSLSPSSSPREPSPEEVTVRKKQAECYGLDREEVALLEKHGIRFFLAEGVKGVNEEALLCLKKTAAGTEGKPASWEAADDYDEFVRELADRERDFRRHSLPQQGGFGDRDSSRKGKLEMLKIDAFFGETDFMIGKKGEEFFRSCWEREEFRDAFDFEAVTIERSNHDSVCECWRGGLEKVFRETRWSLLGESR